jgi:hypothetical protein
MLGLLLHARYVDIVGWTSEQELEWQGYGLLAYPVLSSDEGASLVEMQ